MDYTEITEVTLTLEFHKKAPKGALSFLRMVLNRRTAVAAAVVAVAVAEAVSAVDSAVAAVAVVDNPHRHAG